MRKTGGFQIRTKDNYFFPADAGMINRCSLLFVFHFQFPHTANITWHLYKIVQVFFYNRLLEERHW
jgi:hypothetical protein